jgi:hypothetical protein
MKINAVITLIPLLALSCARFHGRQTDISYETNPITKEVTKREITTDLKGAAWFSSKQDLAKFSAIQTDKSQAFNGTGVNQSGPTNTVAAIEALTKLIKAVGIGAIAP